MYLLFVRIYFYKSYKMNDSNYLIEYTVNPQRVAEIMSLFSQKNLRIRDVCYMLSKKGSLIQHMKTWGSNLEYLIKMGHWVAIFPANLSHVRAICVWKQLIMSLSHLKPILLIFCAGTARDKPITGQYSKLANSV